MKPNRRAREVRAKTVPQELSRRNFSWMPGGPPSEDDSNVVPFLKKPKTRADCEFGPRPCPFVSCSHHLYLDVARNGGLRLNFPDLEPHEMKETCVLDIAENGPQTLETVAEHTNLTKERIRQIELLIYGRRSVRVWAERMKGEMGGSDVQGSLEGRRVHLPMLDQSRRDG